MQSEKKLLWAIAITSDGTEELYTIDFQVGMTQKHTLQMLRAGDQDPKLKRRLRAVPVVVEIRETTDAELRMLREREQRWERQDAEALAELSGEENGGRHKIKQGRKRLRHGDNKPTR